MPTILPVHVQLGLFGGCAEIVGMHVVAAHSRVQADGNEVFVSEHLRWSRGRSGPSATRHGPAPQEPERVPGASQLPLWRG